MEILKLHWEQRADILNTEYQKSLKEIRKESSAAVLNHILTLLKQYEIETVIALDARTQKKIASLRKLDPKKTTTTTEDKNKKPDSEPVRTGTDRGTEEPPQ